MTVLITGATSGFGLSLVTGYLQKGFTVFATGRKITTRQKSFEHLLANKNLHFIDLDLTSSLEIQSALEVIKKHGELKILVNNAGYGLFGPLEEIAPEQLRKQMEVNFFGTAELTRLLLPELRKTQGTIVTFTSILGLVGFPFASAYVASKFALEGLMESVAYEVAPLGVQVMLVEPGAYGTDFSKNIDWAALTTDQSAYHEELQVYKNKKPLKSHDQTQQARIDSLAADVIAQSLKKRVPLRLQYGPDSVSVALLKKVLPGRVYNSIASMAFRKFLAK